MSLGAEVDAEVDLGPLVFELMGGIKASLDTLNKTMRDIRDIEKAYQEGPLELPIRKVATSPSSGNFTIGLGGPAYGRKWEVKRVAVGGVQWSSSVNGTALLVVGTSPEGPWALTPPLSDIVDEAASLPSNAFYSTGQIVVRHPNHLFLVILSPTASTQYAAGGQATDLPDKRVRIEQGQ